jgi:hypothetical protein
MTGDNPNVPLMIREARLLAARCRITEIEIRRLEKEGFQEDKVVELILDTHRLSNKIAPLIRQALRQPPADDGDKNEEWIELSSRWLDAWLGLRLIDEYVLPGGRFEADNREQLGQNLLTYDPIWLAEITRSWVSYYHYLLSYFVLPQIQGAGNGERPDLPTEPEGNAADHARLVLLCEWAHTRGVPRTLPLETWLTKTYESELALYALSGKGSHRQHLFHVQDECLLGCVLLYSCWKDQPKETYLEKLSATSGDFDEKNTIDLLLCNWFVAALLHDIGYALQVIPQGLEALSESMVRALGDMVDDIRQLLSQAPNKIADYDPTPTRASSHLEIGDHAHVSMATVLAHLRLLNDQWRTASAYNQAAAAIIDHDSQNAPIDYAADPLSMLIVLCDQLQDWGRPRLDASALARNFLSNLRKPPKERYEPLSIQELFTSSHLYVNAQLDESCNLVHPTSADSHPIMVFLLDGPEAGRGGYEPAVAWLDTCRAFQRIRPAENVDLPWIHVVLQHNVASDGVSELHRLSRFAYDDPERYGTILDWLAQVRTKEQNFVKYGCSDESYSGFSETQRSDTKESARHEWIKYIIPALNNNENRPLKGLPSKLYRSYHKYRKVSEAKQTITVKKELSSG